jgi:arylsulfatase A-like enzyme
MNIVLLLRRCLPLAVLLFPLLPSLAQKPVTNRPNILVIFSDDHAYQAISAYGGSLVQTPHIDRLANEGALLQNCLVTNSICGPSRATLLTGKYSHLNGYKLNEKKFDISQQIFPRLLQQSGYQTAWIGKWHLGSLPQGFDYWNILPGQGHYYNPDFINQLNDTVKTAGYVTNIITRFSTEWLDNRDTTKPFCLVIGEKATHREWLPDLPDLGAYDDNDFPLPPNFFDDYKGRRAAAQQDMTIDKTMRLKEDLKIHADYTGDIVYSRMNTEQKQAFAAYYENKISRAFDALHLTGKDLVRWKYQRYIKDYLATARSLDRNIGQLLDYLDKTGLSRNTVVIYASDQGFYLGEHGWFDKRFMYEESLRTPFIIRYPGVVAPGTRIDQLVLNIDWAPTILHMAGVPVPEDMQGNSFLPLLKQQPYPDWRTEAYYHYYEFPQPHHVYPHFGIRTQQYKLIRFYGGADSWELFDLKKDPHEMHNLYANPAYRSTIRMLKTKLVHLMEQYQDTEALSVLQHEKAPQ